MTPTLTILILVAYFSFLILVSFLTSNKGDQSSFFTGNKKSPWYIVAFGMIGASLSGVTFISVPGWVNEKHFSYFPMCLGYVLGYFIIAYVLLPLYYKLNLVSIYSYLDQRFGKYSYKTGASFFLFSRIIGASFRLFLVASVLQIMLFNAFNIPFEVTVAVTIGLIWIYTFKSGIKTIVWTDTLQTLFMLSSAGLTIYFLIDALDLNLFSAITAIKESEYSSISDQGNPFLGFLNGALIALVMTGLDQDMMQKNLTINTLKNAQKNMNSFSFVLVFVNLIFLCLGTLLYLYTDQFNISLPEKADHLFPYLATNYFGTFTGIIFLLGIIAAAYSSADSALTALTTSFSIDILDEPNISIRKRTLVHLGFSIVLFGVIVIFNQINDKSVISNLFTMAGYTYGPILGLFILGVYSKIEIKDNLTPIVCIAAPTLTYLIAQNSTNWFGYTFGFELLLLNAILTITGLLAIKK